MSLTNHSLSTLWTKHLSSKEDQKNFTDAVYNNNNNVVLLRLRKLIKEDYEATVKQSFSKQNYASPAWAAQQADYNGTLRTLKELLDLLSFLEDPKENK